MLAPLKRVWLVIVVVIVNAVAIPAIAWLVAEALPISDAYVSGLVLATLGAGSAAALKGAQLAERADLPLAVSLVVVLQLSNIVAVPLWAGRVVSGASLSAWDILKSLLALVLIPLVVGLLVRARYSSSSQRACCWKPPLRGQDRSGGALGRTTMTGQRACSTHWRLTEPSSMLAKPPRPR